MARDLYQQLQYHYLPSAAIPADKLNGLPLGEIDAAKTQTSKCGRPKGAKTKKDFLKLGARC